MNFFVVYHEASLVKDNGKVHSILDEYFSAPTDGWASV
jgi:hypothetical protein